MRINHKVILANKANRIIGLGIVLAITVIGVRLLIVSHAQSPYASTNADSGNVTPPATTQTCSGTANGQCVVFGSAPASLGVHVSNGQIVNSSGQAIRLLGVDTHGTEYACTNGTGFSPTPLNSTEADAIASWHINVVRIPLNEDCWLGINGVPAAYSGANYQNAIKNWVTAINKAGMVAILDLHFAAPGANEATGEWPMADYNNAPTFWTQVASTFTSTPGVIFQVFNEPFIGGTHPTSADWTCWLTGSVDGNINSCPETFTSPGSTIPVTYAIAGMQQLVNTVRATGAKQPILISGLEWSGDPCGVADTGGNGGTCMEVANLPTDPLNQLIVSLHTYGPTKTECVTADCWNTVATATKAAKVPLITDELGENDCSAEYMNQYMDWADQYDVSYLAWTWNVNTSTSCVVGDSDESSNHDLLQSYDGTPTTVSPDGAAYQAHLAMPSVYGSE